MSLPPASKIKDCFTKHSSCHTSFPPYHRLLPPCKADLSSTTFMVSRHEVKKFVLLLQVLAVLPVGKTQAVVATVGHGGRSELLRVPAHYSCAVERSPQHFPFSATGLFAHGLVRSTTTTGSFTYPLGRFVSFKVFSVIQVNGCRDPSCPLDLFILWSCPRFLRAACRRCLDLSACSLVLFHCNVFSYL